MLSLKSHYSLYSGVRAILFVYLQCSLCPRVAFIQVFNESIASVDGGMVGSSFEEVVVATYSGRVFGLSREPVVPKPISQEVQAKLDSMK